jgi:hypothetical protein
MRRAGGAPGDFECDSRRLSVATPSPHPRDYASRRPRTLYCAALLFYGPPELAENVLAVTAPPGTESPTRRFPE